MIVTLDFTQRLPVSTALNFGVEWVPPPPPPPAQPQRVVSTSGAGWSTAQNRAGTIVGGAHTPALKDVQRSASWSAAPHINSAIDSPWHDIKKCEAEIIAAPWSTPIPTSTEIGSMWRSLVARDCGLAVPWGALIPRQMSVVGAFFNPSPLEQLLSNPWDTLHPRAAQSAIAWARLTVRQKLWSIPWGGSTAPRNVWPLPIIAPPVPPPAPPPCEYRPIKGRADLNFSDALPASTKLRFWCRTPTEYLNNRSLILLPTTTITKLPTGEPVEVTQLSLDLDIDSWAWSLRATVPASSLALIMPGSGGAAEIEINLSGHVWRMLVEGFSESHEFGSNSYTVTGRSPAAILAAPYAPTRTHTQNNVRTARQLADEELQNTGWSLDWQAVDWLVPGGVFTYEGLTPLDAIAKIAAAIGAVILPHPSEKTLTITPKYRFSPWILSGAAANNTLDPSILTGLALQWSPQPKYNGIYTSGQHQGVTAFVRRAGSSGDRLAQMIVDPLITTPEAGKERGRQALCAAGNKAKISVNLPLTAHGSLPGLVQPGAVVEVMESPGWKGIVTAVGITADMQSDALVLKQSIEIERHYE